MLLAALALLGPGCSSLKTNPAGTAGIAAPGSSGVTGRDLGRGQATSGGLSSQDSNGNAADMSVYDASHPE